ncbi:hypothetical protein [Rufibacter quisquiliarum]|uniref:Uncharacterized protein n=1 Tax=Rufibacter quisquiliarum TaxID=1549639 RepID=A0A839GRX9_9BACT|nr:hypothetical protein [Rufibacter quisquiliarum]MBA9079619.1 hypothetical protein [Rufibacter quisquiliarum]
MQDLFDRKTDPYFGSLRYLGYLLLPAGIIVAGAAAWSGADAVQLVSVGGLLFLLGLLFQTTHHGFQIDFKNRRVREYLTMFGVKSGNWVPLPQFQKVVLSSNLAPADDHDHAHDHHHDDKPAPLVTWYTIGLYSASPEANFELRTGHQQDALKTLHLLAAKLGVPAEDKTDASL